MLASRSPRARAAALALAAGSLVLSGCGGPSPEGLQGASAQSWTEPRHYAYTLLSTCGERGGLGTFRLWVRDGRVERAKPLREGSDLMPLRQMPTIGDLVRTAAQAQGEGAERVRVTRALDGQPRWITIDYLTKAIDDEACYRLTHLTVLS